MKFLLDSEAKVLIDSLYKGREYRKLSEPSLPNIVNDDILDIIANARRIRQLNAILTIITQGGVLIDIEDGKPIIINDKKEGE